MNNLIEKYIHEYSSPEDPLLEDLYRETHIRFVNPNMSTGHLQGKLLEMISSMIMPRNILEIGTFTGYSAICLARGMRQGGKLYTIEINDELKEFSHSYFQKAGLADSIIQINGRAQDQIPAMEQSIDLVYIDGDKREYSEYFDLSLPKVVPGGYLIADNVLWGEKVLDRDTKDPQTRGIIEFNEKIKHDSSVEKVILPVRDGIMIMRKSIRM